MTTTIPNESLRQLPLFADLSDADLEKVGPLVQAMRLDAGDILMEEGSVGTAAYLIQSGELEVVKQSNNREVLLTVRGAGDVIGEIALVADTPRTATVRARTPAELVVINREQLQELMHASPRVAASLLDIVLARWQATQSQLRHSEKMAQLGTLTAGIAHELNNPAAAVRRSSEQLEKAIADSAETYMQLVSEHLDAAQLGALADFLAVVRAQADSTPYLDPIMRSDRESDLEEWLIDQGADDAAWELGTAMVDLCLTPDQLTYLAATYKGPQLVTVLRYLTRNYEIANLLHELQQGSGRISEIVKALKSYTYLDQAPIVRYNVNRGLDDTLLILRHKLKNDIVIRREYDSDLPEIDAHGSELNQVWTNLLDNAADAIHDNGQTDGMITLRTRRDGKWIVVDIEDNGPGMPPEVAARVFEPFFTTKPVGQGTGLGLDISYNIVVNRHRGDIRIFTEPGSTRFEVWLPQDQAAS
jgi:signal transduction histidine kinase